MTRMIIEDQNLFLKVIEIELTGKNLAQTGYDSIIWKIRTGFLIFIYGLISVIVSFLNTFRLSLDFHRLGLIIIMIVVGMSVACQFLDIYFLKCKLRVVAHTNRLNDLLINASLGVLSQNDIEEIKDLLHNAGEKKDKVMLKGWGSTSPLIIYPITVVIAIAVVIFLIW